MYLDYWQLEAKPFEPTADPRFAYRSEGRQAASHKLRYAIEGGRAAAVLSGPAGTGKTMLCASIAEQLPARFRPFVSVNYPLMSAADLLSYLAEQLGAPQADPPRHTIEVSLRRIEFVLRENARKQQHAVVVVDEAHLLEDAGLFEPLRLLLNLTVASQPAFTLVLVGQAELAPAVERHGSLDDRIDLKAYLPALSLEETAGYVQHRLSAAGASREIFTPDGLTAIHSLSGGVPRRINRLADLALLVGFANEQHAIDAAQLEAVHEELVAGPLRHAA